MILLSKSSTIKYQIYLEERFVIIEIQFPSVSIPKNSLLDISGNVDFTSSSNQFHQKAFQNND